MSEILEAVVASARAYLGPPPTRFVHQGRSRDLGVDCIGLTLGGFAEAGAPISCPRADYEKLATGEELHEALEARGFRRVLDGSERVGQVLVFAFVRRIPQHMALRTDRGMIHCWSAAEVVTEHPITRSWRNRLVSVWEHPCAAPEVAA